MTVTTLPLFADPVYTYSASLENKPFNFRFAWNERSLAWHMDLAAEDGAPVLLGLKLVPDFAMVFDYALQAAGLTGFFVLTASNEKQAALPMTQPQELAERFILQYTTT